MPAKNRFLSNYASDLLEHLPTEDLTFDGKAATLFVIQQRALFPKLRPQQSVFKQEILDHILLMSIDPAGQNQKQ